MLYCGVDLYADSFKVSALTDGFAHLETKYFNHANENSLFKWIASLRSTACEPCAWFFNEKNFNKQNKILSVFNFNKYYYEIFLVNNRKFLNIMQFLYAFIIKTDAVSILDIDTSFVLASSMRLFSPEEMLSFKYLYTD